MKNVRALAHHYFAQSPHSVFPGLKTGANVGFTMTLCSSYERSLQQTERLMTAVEQRAHLGLKSF